MESATKAVEQLSPPFTEQENAEGSDDEEIINVEDEKPPPPAITTAADGTLRIRRQELTPKAPAARSGPLCCSDGSAVDGNGTVVEGIAVGRTFPFLGDPEATWANVEETVKRELGGPYPLRRNNRQKLFRAKDEHERSVPNRWAAVRIECAQAGAPNNRPLMEDCKKRRKTSSKKINCNWKVVCQWPQRSQGPYISQVHLFHDTALEGEHGGKVHPPPKVSEDEISKEEVVAQEDKIKELVDAGFGTTELHKYLQRDGKPLGEPGKQKVRNIRRKYTEAKAALSGEQKQNQPTPPPPPPQQQRQQPQQPQQQPQRQRQHQQQQPPPPPPPQQQQPQQPPPPRPPQPQHGGGSSPPSSPPPPLLPVTAKPFVLAATVPASSPGAFISASPSGGNSSAGPPAVSGAHTNGAPPAPTTSLEATKLADCIAFGKELASMSAGIKSRDALDRVIAHARVAAETAIKVELQCQGRRVGAD